MRALTNTAVLCFASLFSAAIPLTAVAQPCFAPLSDPASRDSSNFVDLAKQTTAKPMPGVKKFLPLVVAEDDKANIDYYYIRFTRHPKKTPEQVFKDLRLNFNRFAAGTTKVFGFGPYKETGSDSDSIGRENAKLWAKDVPLNAVMSFNLDTPMPATRMVSIVGSSGSPEWVRGIVNKAGDLQVTCASKLDFVFSTVESENGGPHPVSGNRGFGLKDNGDGTWTFYSKAVDRRTTGEWNPKIILGTFFDTFCRGHDFWKSYFYPEMYKYLESKGMTPTEPVWIGNHGPVPFPFKPGPQPATAECK